MADIRIEDHGSIVLLQPVTKAGREWLDGNIGGGVAHCGSAVVAEPRYEEWGNEHGQGAASDPSSLRRLRCCRGRCRAFVFSGSNGLRVDVAETSGPHLANE